MDKRDERAEREIPGLSRIVGVILHNALASARSESEARGGQSPLAWVLWCLELGAIVHTTGRDAPEPRPLVLAPIPPLDATATMVRRAIEADGQGLALVTRAFGVRQVEMSFEQRIGWLLASDRQREKWALKIASGDSQPALEGARELGETQLRAFVKHWLESEVRQSA
ncbi:MAG: hypothetical protein JNK05_34855 [Myxococcales bacterium]|nr:hypothetical protein [Myxococcales bacterium]